MAEKIRDKIKPVGDVRCPVRAGNAFATIKPGTDADSLAPTKKGWDANWVLGEDGQSLMSSVLGLARVGSGGIRVVPLFKLSKDRSRLTVDVYSKDNMGRAISLDELAEAIGEHFGDIPYDSGVLERAVAQAAKNGEPLPKTVLAQGTPPERGLDAWLEMLFRSEKAAGSMREDGSMDYRERGDLVHVSPGDPVAVLHPATAGKPGQDIYGKPVKARDGLPLEVKAGEGVKVTPGENGKLEYTATAEGIPQFSYGELRISGTFEIKGDVDLDSGNVRSDRGVVVVKGAVRSGFSVQSGSDVTVEGIVEDAMIEAQGAVFLNGGAHMAENGLISSGGDVEAKFLEHARIKAAGNVTSKKDIIQCDIRSDGLVSANDGQGNVVGGTVRSKGGLKARDIGNESALNTEVEIFVHGPRGEELEERRKAFEDKAERLVRAIGSDDAVGVLLQAPEEDRRILAELIKIKSDVDTALKALDKEIDADREEGEAELASVAVKALGTVYPGVSICFAGRTFKVTEPMQGAVFRWDAKNREITTG